MCLLRVESRPPPARCVEALTPEPPRMWPSSGTGLGPVSSFQLSVTGVLIRGGNCTQVCTRGDRHVNIKADQVTCLQAEEQERLPGNHQKLGERQGTDLLASRPGHNPLLRVEGQGLGSFVTVALVNKCSTARGLWSNILFGDKLRANQHNTG